MSRHMGQADRSDIWLTPPFVIDALGGAGSFDLDPCAPVIQPWPTAQRRYTEEDNGLVLPWDGRVWLNPPYSQTLMAAFMQRLVDHGNGVALIFAKTETEMFFRHVWNQAHGLIFIKSRLHFYRPDGTIAPHNSGAPSVLVAYGTSNAEILSTEPIEGQFVPLRIPRSWLINLGKRSWRDALREFFEEQGGPVSLDQLYDFFAHDPKSSRNPNWRAKVRQTLRRAQYVNVGRGLWATP